MMHVRQHWQWLNVYLVWPEVHCKQIMIIYRHMDTWLVCLAIWKPIKVPLKTHLELSCIKTGLNVFAHSEVWNRLCSNELFSQKSYILAIYRKGSVMIGSSPFSQVHRLTKKQKWNYASILIQQKTPISRKHICLYKIGIQLLCSSATSKFSEIYESGPENHEMGLKIMVGFFKIIINDGFF